MKRKISASKLIFGLAIFAGFLPLTFLFSKNGTQLLLDTSFKYAIWSGQIIILLLILLAKQSLNTKQLAGLGILYLLVPFMFIFTENSVSFIILGKHISSILSWAIAGVLAVKLFFVLNFKHNTNH